MDLFEWIKENSKISIDEKQADILFTSLDVNGYSIEVDGTELFLNSVDELGENSKKVTIDQIIVLATNFKYKETEKIMDSLDEIRTISTENIKTYCENLVDLMQKEKELHLIEKALVQTDHFKNIKNMLENKPKKVSR